MHGEALGLVDDDEVRVLVDDRERDGLRLGLGRLGRRHAHDDSFAGLHSRPEVVHDFSIARHGPGADQRLQARAAEVRQTPGQEPVEALAGLVGRRGQRILVAIAGCCRSAALTAKSEPPLIAWLASLIDGLAACAPFV